MKHYFWKKITNLQEMQEFFQALHKDGLLFHPEDSPESVTTHDGPLFNKRECELLKERIQEVYALDSNPCSYILTLGAW